MARRAELDQDWPRLARRVGDLLAVVAHGLPLLPEGGAPSAAALEAPVELLLVTREPATAHARVVIEERLRGPRERWRTMEAHRVRWLRPSVYQQSLRLTGRTLWGDGAALASVPAWASSQIDKRTALDELDAAEAELKEGRPALAAWRAEGALLIARGAYEFAPRGRATALAQAWPEACPLPPVPLSLIDRCRRLVEDWLFTWEGGPPERRLAGGYAGLRRAAGAAGARPTA